LEGLFLYSEDLGVEESMIKPTIFIGSSNEGLAVAAALRRNLESDANTVIQAGEIFEVGEYPTDTLLKILDGVDIGILVLTHEDLFSSARGTQFQRDNVVFELGLFMGRLGRSRTLVVMEDEGPNHRLPSDLAGLRVIRFRSATPDNLVEALAAVSVQVLRVIQDRGEERSSRAEKSIEPYSCFVSYSAKDKRFAEQIYNDLQDVGVRCWLDAKDLKVGDSLGVEMKRAIQATDKVLLVLSAESIKSRWVRKEIELALEKEPKSNKTILFPIRIDDAVMNADDELSRSLVNTKHIGDFTAWRDSDSYKRAFSRLVKDLTVTAAAEQNAAS
jgi:hypothetical protein